MQLVTIADIVGGGAAVALSGTEVYARMIVVTAIGGTARLGDANVGAAQGVELPQTVPVTLYADTEDIAARFDLSRIKVYLPNGTTLTVSYAA